MIRSPSPSFEQIRNDHELRGTESRRSSSIWIEDSDSDSIAVVAHGRKRSYSSVRQTIAFLVIPSLLAGSFQIGQFFARRSLQSRLEQVVLSRDELLGNQEQLLKERAEISRYEKENQQLTKNLQQVQDELEQRTLKLMEKEQEASRVEQDVKWAVSQFADGASGNHFLNSPKTDLVTLMRTMAYDRYGEEKQNVEFSVRIWDDDIYQDGTFTVEMASFDDMPVTSFFFLEQVDKGLWDGTSFYINAPHVLVAQPVSGTLDRHYLPDMEVMGLARVPVLETSSSENFAHQAYTMGFGGTISTAGSYFFLNKSNNARSHSGQACFARVVDGFDVVDKMTSLDTDASHHIQPVDILSARIVDLSSVHESRNELRRDEM